MGGLMKPIKELAASFDRMKAEKERAAGLVVDAFPLGSEAWYEHGGRLRFVRIVDHSPGTLRVKVRGVTGAEYWIGVWDLLREMVDGFGR
jgi:hypothetical protein